MKHSNSFSRSPFYFLLCNYVAQDRIPLSAKDLKDALKRKDKPVG